jgi:hypothetical protein
MRAVRLLPLVFLVVVAACSEPDPVELTVGAHAISVLFPEEWEHLDYGDKHQFRKDFERIALEDLGRQGGTLGEAAVRVMTGLGENERRSEATRRLFSISGREALEIDTWDNTSHEFRKRYVFVRDKRNLLAIHMMQGKFADMKAPFGDLVASLAYTDSLEIESDPVTGGRD